MTQTAVTPEVAAVPETAATSQAAATTETPPDRIPSNRKWVALAVVLLAAFLDNVDSTIVTVALPSIQKDLGADFATAQWTLAGYALAFAVFLITGGRLGDIFGRKRLFITGVVGFTLASVVCGAAATRACWSAAGWPRGSWRR